jgi:ribonucleoside-diphosphate reductase alpha chain
LPKWPGTGTEGEGYLLGLLIGDGTLMHDKAVLAVWAADIERVANGRVDYSATGAAGIVAAVESSIAPLRHRADFRGVWTANRRIGACPALVSAAARPCV